MKDYMKGLCSLLKSLSSLGRQLAGGGWGQSNENLPGKDDYDQPPSYPLTTPSFHILLEHFQRGKATPWLLSMSS